MIEVRISPQTQRDMQVLARKLRVHGNAAAIRREMTAGMRAAAKPAEKAVKAAAIGLPAGTGQSTGLRQRIAGATGISVRTGKRTAGVRLRVARNRMGDQAALPRYMNRPGHWRHPVFGNTEAWVSQSSRAGWFDDTIRGHLGRARAEMAKVAARILKRLG